MTEAVNTTAIRSAKVTSIPKRSATSNAVNDLYNILPFFEKTTPSGNINEYILCGMPIASADFIFSGSDTLLEVVLKT